MARSGTPKRRKATILYEADMKNRQKMNTAAPQPNQIVVREATDIDPSTALDLDDPAVAELLGSEFVDQIRRAVEAGGVVEGKPARKRLSRFRR